MFKVNIEVVRGKADFSSGSHLYLYEIIGTVDLDDYPYLYKVPGGYTVLSKNSYSVNYTTKGIWLSKMYSHIQSIEELKILMDMKGRRVVSKNQSS